MRAPRWSVTRPRAVRAGTLLRAMGGVAALWAVAWLVNRSLVAVRGPSMLPTLRPGERLLTVPACGRRLQPGRVVVVEDPAEPGHLVVKRIARSNGTGTTSRVLVLGDNPEASTDGRWWGPVPATAVRRIVVARWPSLSRAGLTRRTPRDGTSGDGAGVAG